MNKQKICILDYKSGNVGSVYNMTKYMNYTAVISNDEKDIKQSTHLILPGVGSFSRAMKNINSLLPLKIIEKEIFDNKKPFLGICVGMQVLASKGFEYGENIGLGWIDGEVNILDSKKLPLPNIGWNEIIINEKSKLTDNLEGLKDFYFVHSYKMDPKDKLHINAYTEYGEKFCSIVNSNNIFGVQFHPEKSQKSGMKLLSNFFNCN